MNPWADHREEGATVANTFAVRDPKRGAGGSAYGVGCALARNVARPARHLQFRAHDLATFVQDNSLGADAFDRDIAVGLKQAYERLYIIRSETSVHG